MNTHTDNTRDHDARDAKRTPQGKAAARTATLDRKAARVAKRFIVGGAK